MSLLKMLKNGSKKILLTTPSHSQKSPFNKEFETLYKYDFSEIDGFDNLQNPTGEIKRAEEKISEIYGTKQSFILLNGSTSGILAIMLAILNDKDKILVARNCHKSVFNGAILTGANIDWILPDYNEEFGIYGEISPKTIENAIKINNYKALIITSPTYEGINSDVEKIAEICHQYGVYLIVDEAHGSLLNFAQELGKTAIKQGADFSVNSLHKNAGGINPLALLHVADNNMYFDLNKIREALNLITTTSPNYLMLAMAESVVNFLNSDKGKKKIEELIKNIKNFEEKLSKYGYKFLPQENRDITKIVLKKEGISAKTLSSIMSEKYKIEDEIEEENSVLYLTGIGTTKNKLQKLFNSLKKIKIKEDIENKIDKTQPMPCVKINPKKANYSKTKLISKSEALNKISGETIVPYPPCIPVLCKGELISEWHMKYLDEYVEVIEDE